MVKQWFCMRGKLLNRRGGTCNLQPAIYTDKSTWGVWLLCSVTQSIKCVCFLGTQITNGGTRTQRRTDYRLHFLSVSALLLNGAKWDLSGNFAFKFVILHRERDYMIVKVREWVGREGGMQQEAERAPWLSDCSSWHTAVIKMSFSLLRIRQEHGMLARLSRKSTTKTKKCLLFLGMAVQHSGSLLLCRSDAGFTGWCCPAVPTQPENDMSTVVRKVTFKPTRKCFCFVCALHLRSSPWSYSKEFNVPWGQMGWHQPARRLSR